MYSAALVVLVDSVISRRTEVLTRKKADIITEAKIRYIFMFLFIGLYIGESPPRVEVNRNDLKMFSGGGYIQYVLRL